MEEKRVLSIIEECGAACVSFELDVTNFKKHVKENNWPFTMAFIFAITKCANEIEDIHFQFT
jgi:chloramphenicol O-acetyltransferase type B